MWETFVGHDEEMKGKYQASNMPRRIGMAPSSNFALHLDPNKARTPEQREKFKEFLMIDLVPHDRSTRWNRRRTSIFEQQRRYKAGRSL